MVKSEYAVSRAVAGITGRRRASVSPNIYSMMKKNQFLHSAACEMHRSTFLTGDSSAQHLSLNAKIVGRAPAANNHLVPLQLVKLTALMERTSGRTDIRIGLIDGPVLTHHPDLVSDYLHEVPGTHGGTCTQATSAACLHGTFIAGILSAKRSSSAPAICPSCTLVVRPIFPEKTSGRESMPSATPHELAVAIQDCLDAGVRVINLSLALVHPSTMGEQALDEVINQCAKRGVLVAVAAGNQGMLGSSAITRHPWVIPVVACDLQGKPLSESNIGSSIGRHGLSAPGASITSLGTTGQLLTLGGTSVAVPFVTGAIALLWSEFPAASAAQIKLAITNAHQLRRAAVVPPLLDAASAYRTLLVATARR